MKNNNSLQLVSVEERLQNILLFLIVILLRGFLLLTRLEITHIEVSHRLGILVQNRQIARELVIQHDSNDTLQFRLQLGVLDSLQVVVLANGLKERLSIIRERFGQLALNAFSSLLPRQRRTSAEKSAGSAPWHAPSESSASRASDRNRCPSATHQSHAPCQRRGFPRSRRAASRPSREDAPID